MPGAPAWLAMPRAALRRQYKCARLEAQAGSIAAIIAMAVPWARLAGAARAATARRSSGRRPPCCANGLTPSQSIKFDLKGRASDVDLIGQDVTALARRSIFCP